MAIDVIGQIELEHHIRRIEDWKQKHQHDLTGAQNYILLDALDMLWQIAHLIEANEPTTLPEVKK